MSQHSFNMSLHHLAGHFMDMSRLFQKDDINCNFLEHKIKKKHAVRLFKETQSQSLISRLLYFTGKRLNLELGNAR